MNPDAWVAGRNIDRFEAGKPLDTTYLSTLSADAVPVIHERLPREVAQCVTEDRGGPQVFEDDLLSWNLGRARAQSALEGDGRPSASTGCADVLEEEYRR